MGERGGYQQAATKNMTSPLYSKLKADRNQGALNSAQASVETKLLAPWTRDNQSVGAKVTNIEGLDR